MCSPRQRDSMGIESDSLGTAVVKSKPLILPTIWNNAYSSLDLLAFGVFSPLLIFYAPRATRTRQGRGIRLCEKGKVESYFRLQPSTCPFEQETCTATQHPFCCVVLHGLGPPPLPCSTRHRVQRIRLICRVSSPKRAERQRMFLECGPSPPGSELVAVLSAARVQGIPPLRGRCQSCGGLECRLCGLCRIRTG